MKTIQYQLNTARVDDPTQKEKQLWLYLTIDETGAPISGSLDEFPLEFEAVEHLWGRLWELGVAK